MSLEYVFGFIVGAPLLVVVVMIIRNEMVFRFRGRVIAWAYANPREWQQRRMVLDSPSYGAMVWDLRKWTFKQFYPKIKA